MLDLIPPVNATFNSLSFICLLFAWFFIKKENAQLHKTFIIAAFIFSALFLTGYIYLHLNVGTTKFPEIGLIKTFYLIVLFVHTVLAAALLPLIFITVRRIIKGEKQKHKEIAKITMPIWLFVSSSGVFIYFMLYQWFPAGS